MSMNTRPDSAITEATSSMIRAGWIGADGDESSGAISASHAVLSAVASLRHPDHLDSKSVPWDAIRRSFNTISASPRMPTSTG